MDAGSKSTDSPLYRYRFGTAEFDEAHFDLRVGGLAVEVEQRPLEVLAMLLRHADEAVTREELLDAIWGHPGAPEAPLNQAVQKLRRALGEENARLIHAPSRIGFRLEGPVVRVNRARPESLPPAPQAGEQVPGRHGWILDRSLASSEGVDVWVALHARTEARRVFKLCRYREDLAGLRHEATLARHLVESLGERDDLARLLNWNFEHPPYFLEYEYGGDPLPQWAAADGHLAALDLEQRIALFLQVADAITFAHTAGVLHKDIKPSNVLVSRRTDSWQVRLTGFGYNRWLEPGRLVDLAVTSTTPEGINPARAPLYLAPELIAGRAPTVQSDVYALGMLLYQLLAGDFDRPMGVGWEGDIDDELVREDLAQATDGSPVRRFSSSAELARRLRRREERRGERARDRAAAVYARDTARALGQSRARRPFVIAAMILLTAGLGASAWHYRVANMERREAERAAARAHQIDRFLTYDVLAAAEPAAPGAVDDPTMREVLERSAARIVRFADDPITTAALHQTLGHAWLRLGEGARAVEDHRRAVALLSDARGETDPVTLDAQYQLVVMLALTGAVDEAGKRLAATDEEAGDRLKSPTPLALQAHWAQATVARAQQRHDAALEHLRAAQTLQESLAPRDDVWTMRILDSLSDSLFRVGRMGDAYEALKPLIDPAWTPERLGPVRWATLRLRFASILKSLQRLDQAEDITRLALERLEQTNGPDDYFVGVALNQLADLQGLRGRWGDALAPSKRADAIVRARLGETSQTAWLSRVNLGVIEFQVGQYAQAAQDLREGRDGLAGLLGAESPQAQGAAFFLASALSELGRQEEAWNLADALDPAALAASVMGEAWTPRLAALKGQIRLRQGRRTEGLAILQPAVEEMEKSGLQAWILEPYRKALAEAKAGS